ncbi:RraA family protein [Roseomonas sp. HJA6]|uniref:Putative 4-hydroxy-4-methyl-2-oxoglutarate aldolase n=1 Tax=Roseomonas alba TaxID=2846776 RepID=A0ABS7AAF6_9PROT|nr:RraA family protein [Neoroseomonas alba]MBW6399283.1 RraA family protein [Neoroseomonas alba]
MMDAVTPADLSGRYAQVPVGVLSDVLAKAGAPYQVLSREMRAFAELPPFAGPAFCVRARRAMGGAPPVKDLRFDLYRQFRREAVLIMATGGYGLSAVLGENVAASLRQSGCVGIVTDGGYRDRDGIAALGMPMRACYLTPMSSGGQMAIAELDVTVTLPGEAYGTVEISPGDMVVGDADGVIVVPQRGLTTILEDAERLIVIEARTRSMIESGEDSEVAYKANERFGHIRRI